MDDLRRRECERLFNIAVELSPSDRLSFLKTACDDDEARLKVERLLVAIDQAGDFLETPLAETDSPSLIGQRMGRYLIKYVLGHGSMGDVYAAEQENPKRTVALKVVRSHSTSEEAQERLQQEANALARLKHPFIAQIYEAGTDGDGSPFIAMEMIEGRTLAEYVESPKRQLSEKLDLIVDGCQAVQHAHNKGVIHLDLKPSNILVTDEGVLKILDFGIARIIHRELAECHHTATSGGIGGTWPYMSPEQRRGNPDEIDGQSDVYALGRIALELLTGLPADSATDAPIEHALWISRGEHVAAAGVARALRGDLGAVLRKALAEDKSMRYASPSELGADIQRFLCDEPVAARPATFAYKSRKLIARHKVLFALTCILSLVVTTFGAVATVQAIRIAEERNKARASQVEAEDHFDVAQKVANTLLVRVCDELPKITRTRELQLQLLLEAKRLYEELARREPKRLDLRRGVWVSLQRIGDALLSLGRVEEARQSFALFHQMVLRAARAEPGNVGIQEDLVISWERQSAVAIREGRLRDASVDLQRSLEISRTLSATLAYEERYQQAVQLACCRLGDIARRNGELDVAERYYAEQLATCERLVAHDPTDSAHLADYAWAHERLGRVAQDRGDFLRAEEAFGAFLKQSETLRESHPNNPTFIDMCANGYEHIGDLALASENFPLAEERYEDAWQLSKQLFDAEPKNPAYVEGMSSICLRLGKVAERQDGKAAARKKYEEFRSLIEPLANSEPDYACYQEKLAWAHKVLGELLIGTEDGQAKAHFQSQYKIWRGLAERPDAQAEHLRAFAELLLTSPFPEQRDAVAALRAAKQASSKAHGKNPAVLGVLGSAYDANGERTDALQAVEAALALLPPGSSRLRTDLEGLRGRLLADAGDTPTP